PREPQISIRTGCNGGRKGDDRKGAFSEVAAGRDFTHLAGFKFTEPNVAIRTNGHSVWAVASAWAQVVGGTAAGRAFPGLVSGLFGEPQITVDARRNCPRP